MARFVIPMLVFGGLVAVFFAGLGRDPSELPSPFLGKTAPGFELPTLKDPEVTVSNEAYNGKHALVNVWATWCVGCRQEHAYLMELSERNELPIYGLNWRDNRDDALDWLAQLGDPYVASGFDADGRTGIDWGVYGAPETFLISPEGIVLHKHLGPLDESIWQRDFAPHLAAAAEQRQ